MESGPTAVLSPAARRAELIVASKLWPPQPGAKASLTCPSSPQVLEFLLSYSLSGQKEARSSWHKVTDSVNNLRACLCVYIKADLALPQAQPKRC
jgi:hypothetical protein